MLDDVIIVIAKEMAARYSLPSALVCAVIEQESGGNNWAMRYEPAFFARYVGPRLAAGMIGGIGQIDAQTEATARATSWGLMQVMGETARENTYYGPLAALCDPAVGVQIGCRVLARKFALAKKKLGTDTETDSNLIQYALELWNGGGNPMYADQVMSRMEQYKNT